MRRILVTGGAGFIGSAFIRRAVADGYSVFNLDKLTYAGDLRSLSAVANSDQYRFAQIDIADLAAVRAAMHDFRPNAVIHLAAESHVDRSIDGPAAFLETNVRGTFAMLEAATEYWLQFSQGPNESFIFVHVSTDEVFGSLGRDGKFTSSSRYDPRSPYSASKAAADHFVRAWRETYGLPAIVTNCSNNYGPFQHPEKLIPTVLHNALAGKPIPIYGKGENIRDWIYVEDHVAGLFAALERGQPGECYLFGGDGEMRNIDLCRKICDYLDTSHPREDGRSYTDLICFVQDRPGHDLRYAIDSSETNLRLGWRPTHTVDAGLRLTVDWYLNHPHWLVREQNELARLGVARSAATTRKFT